MWLERVTREVRKYDDQLYAQRSDDGVPCVFRKRKSVERHEIGNCVILKVVDRPDLVFPLTDNWLFSGHSVEWGIEPILHKLRSCDQASRDIFQEMNKHNERVDESRKKDFSNKIEAWAYDARKAFAKSTDHINTSQIKNDYEFEKKNEERRKWLS